MIRSVLTTLALSLAVTGCADLGIGAGADTYKGDFGGALVWTNSGRVSCVTTYAVAGTVEIVLERSGNDVTGEGTVELTQRPGSPSPAGCAPAPERRWGGKGPVSGTKSAIRFSHGQTTSDGIAETVTAGFLGVLDFDVIAGHVLVEHGGSETIGGAPGATSGSGAFAVTLRR